MAIAYEAFSVSADVFASINSKQIKPTQNIRKGEIHMRKKIVLTMLVLCAAFAFTGCKKKVEKVDMDDITTTQESTTDAVTNEPTTTAPPSESTTAAVKKAYAEENTYLHKNLGIKFPQIANMEDSDKQTTVNEQIKADIMSAIEGYKLNEEKDSLNLTYTVSSLDREKIVILYEGSYQKDGSSTATELFLTDTISLKTGKHTRLSDYVDAKTLSNLLASGGEYKVVTDDASQEKEIREYLAKQKATDLEKSLSNADFGGSSSSFPTAFSYEKQGVIYFTVPVSHALGDYALIGYTPETK